MYLKAIEIQGFKSFPDKTVMTFDSDITAIVGPNGSGKSNISDAIRWVMGEMSTKALRGGKMEDVIFGGTMKRPQVGFAEVSLVLDNAEHIFDMEAPEIMVTRRYYRSGDSEYYINRQSARLKDINELFMDTGLGREGYCNIGQGRIDEILSAKSTDRREIFEEAAGISKYRHRKEETERKLQQTQDNLLRINDKISELELQVTPLKEQAEKAKKYLVYRDELRGLEVTVWLSQMEKLSETAKKTEADFQEAKQILEQGKADLEALYQKAETLSQGLREMDMEAEKLRGEISELETRAAENRSEDAVLEARFLGNTENIERLRNELTDQESRNGDLAGQIEARMQRIEEIARERETHNTVIGQKETLLQTCQREADERERERNRLTEERGRLLTLAAELRSSISANQQSEKNILDRKAQVEETYRQAEEKRAAAEQETAENVAKLEEAQGAVESLKNAISGYELRAQGRIKKRESLQQTVSDLKIQLDTMDSRIHMYKEMERDYEGYSKATRIVMQEADRGNLKHIHGPVSGLIRTEDAYTLAVETALGVSAGSVVVDAEQDGKAAIQLLKRRDGGRATFLPLDIIRGRRLQENGLDRQKGFVGLASDLVTCDSTYRDVIENLLGRTVVAEHMDAAIGIANRHSHRFRIVTLDGQVLNAGGSMTGGSAAHSSGVLTRANELSRLQKQRQETEAKWSAANEQLQGAAMAAAQAEAEIADAQNRLREAEDQALRLMQQRESDNVLLSTLSGAITAAEKELEIVDGLLSGGESERESLSKKAQACQTSAEALECRITEEEQTQAALELQISTLTEELTEIRVKTSALDAEAESARQSREELETLREALSGDKAQRESLIAEYESENQSILAQREQRDQTLRRLQERLGQKKEQLQTLGQRRLALEGKKTRAEKEAQQKNKDLMDMERESARLEQKKVTTEMEEKQILDKLWENYELTSTTARDVKVEIESTVAAQKRIGDLRRKMSALGHPNIGAIEEYDRVNERYQYLTEQRDDVESSRTELLKIVQDITGEMTGIFVEEFRKINENFGKTFTEMFGGGKASLQLEDENDVLSCGIEIKVQPPGKQVKTIMLLSGGEKAFVAIALYFAIMKVRPTPFCMLDEIDAALDDRNVTRFATYLRNLSGRTQFIVITHRRGTMEAADVLYGVTMQEQGVSKVLSVDLNQVVKELNIT